MKVVFMGSADFGIPALEALRAHGHRIAAVVSTPAKPRGRGRKLQDSQITHYAKQHNLGPIFTPQRLKDPELARKLKALEADIFVVVAFRILPPEIFSIPPFGTVNIHASLLPSFRGPAPIQRAIESGEKTTGITIFQIDVGIDTGKVLLRRRTDIGENETTPQLYERLSAMGAQGLVEALECIQNDTCEPVAQEDKQATGAPKLKKEEAIIDWRESSTRIFNRIRAFKPFPGTVTHIGGKRLGIEWARPSRQAFDAEPGSVVAIQPESFTVACGEGSLSVLEVKPEGKKAMNVGAFLRGHAMEKGLILK
ncbi:MAG: methionyl-tRNA formyltransferase [Chitinivibrionales bacterium]